MTPEPTDYEEVEDYPEDKKILKKPEPLDYEEVKGYPEDEKIIKELIPVIQATIERHYLTGTTYRDTHSKGHAAARVQFIVEQDLPEELAVGLFSKAKAYDAWMRFSNLSVTPEPDIQKDTRACAIKLMDVDGKKLWPPDSDDRTLDILMMGSPTFLAPNVPVFYEFQQALLKGGLTLAGFLATHPRTAATIYEGQTLCASVLEIPYFSQTAYRFGDKVVRYHMKPLTEMMSEIPEEPTPNFLRERLSEDLEKESADFDFMVQFQMDREKMPVENPMVNWPEPLSPYRKVATVRLLKQKGILSPAMVEFCENLSFNAWRTLEENKPLGSINWARRRVYEEIAKFRRGKNDVSEKKRREPTPDFNPEGLSFATVKN